MGMCERSGDDVKTLGMSPRKDLNVKVKRMLNAGGDDLGAVKFE